MTRDQLLADLKRALDASFPEERAALLLRELEQRLPESRTSAPADPGGVHPRAARGELLSLLAPAVKRCFPDRTPEILSDLTRRMWPLGMLGLYSDFDPRKDAFEQVHPWEVELERDLFPSFVVVGPADSRFHGVRLLMLKEHAVAGRSRGVDFRLHRETVARRHLELQVLADGRVMVRDLGSHSGIYVNRARTEFTVLMDGDELTVGDLHLRYIAARTGGPSRTGDPA